MSSKEFVHKYNLKNRATSNRKIQQILSFLGLKNVGIYLRDGLFESDIGLVNLHPKTKHIGFVLKTKFILIVMVLYVQRNYLNLI